MTELLRERRFLKKIRDKWCMWQRFLRRSGTPSASFRSEIRVGFTQQRNAMKRDGQSCSTEDVRCSLIECPVWHGVPHLRRLGLFCGVTRALRPGLNCAAPPALALCSVTQSVKFDTSSG